MTADNIVKVVYCLVYAIILIVNAAPTSKLREYRKFLFEALIYIDADAWYNHIICLCMQFEILNKNQNSTKLMLIHIYLLLR